MVGINPLSAFRFPLPAFHFPLLSLADSGKRIADLTQIHTHQELGIALGAIHAVGQQLHRLDRVHVAENLAQNVHAAQFLRVHEQVFLARAGAVYIDGRPDALIDHAAIKMQLHVASALELLEDHFIHATAGVDEGGRQDGQRAAFLDVAGRPEETLRLVQGVGVHTAGQDFAGMRNLRVVRARQPRDGVEQDHYVGAVFDHALGLFDDHLADLNVPRGRLVEGRTDDLGVVALDGAFHLRHFLGPFVDEQHDDVTFGMVAQHAVGDLLQQDGFAGAGWRDDQAALPLADRRHQIHDAHVDFGWIALQVKPRVGV